VRIAVPFAPGASNDLIARAGANGLQPLLGQPVPVENRPGAGGAIGAASVAAAPPDGYTLMIATTSIAMAAAVQPTPYNPARDFTAVRQLAQSAIGVVVAGDSPFHSLSELVEAARSRPGRIRYGSAGPGTVNHFAGALFALRAGLQLEHVPYRGMSPAILDMLGGRIEVGFPSLPSVAGQLRSGEARLLAVLAPQRQPDMPEVPTAREQGVDIELLFWWGILGPKGLPDAVVQQLDQALGTVLGTPEMLRFLAHEGATPSRINPEEFQHLLVAETARWAEVARLAGITVG
jgi:tripartite-type tricarboxylate transporter receptor subunit TctC